MTDVSHEISWDDVYHLLSSPRRRKVVLILSRRSEWDLGDLATEVAEREHDGPVSSQDRKTVYVSLYQTHIEKLEKHRVVEWDQNENIVRAGDSLEELASIHKCAKEVREGSFKSDSFFNRFLR